MARRQSGPLHSYFGVPPSAQIPASTIRAELGKLDRLRRQNGGLQTDEREIYSMLRQAARLREVMAEGGQRNPKALTKAQAAIARVLRELAHVEKLPAQDRQAALAVIAEECAHRMRR